MNKLVCLKYVVGLASKTEVVPVPDTVHFDHDSKLWWIIGAHIWVKTQIGEHLLYLLKDGQKHVLNYGQLGAIIGVYDESDPKQVKALRRDARLAVKPQQL